MSCSEAHLFPIFLPSFLKVFIHIEYIKYGGDTSVSLSGTITGHSSHVTHRFLLAIAAPPMLPWIPLITGGFF